MTLTFRICWGLSRVHFHIKEHSSNVECTFSAVPIQKPTGPNLILQYHKSRTTKGYNLCKLCSTAIQDDTYHFFKAIEVREKKIFTIWRPSWSCDMDQMYELSFSP